MQLKVPVAVIDSQMFGNTQSGEQQFMYNKKYEVGPGSRNSGAEWASDLYGSKKLQQ